MVSASANSVAQKFKYNGIELEESLGLNLYEMDFRQYDPAIARFTGIDPVTHFEYSTYNAFDNNPIIFADPSGANADWIPEVDKNGNITYVAEQGDSAETLSQQFGISQEIAEQITGTTGDAEIAEGTQVSGETVAKVTGSEVLKLDTTDKNTTDTDIVNQTLFAVKNEYVQDHLGNGGADRIVGTGNVYDYFSTNNIHSNDGTTYGFSSNARFPVTKNIGNGNTVSLSVDIGQSNNGRFSSYVSKIRQTLVNPKNNSYRTFFDYNYPRSENQPTRGIKSLTGRNITISLHSGSRILFRNYLEGK